MSTSLGRFGLAHCPLGPLASQARKPLRYQKLMKRHPSSNRGERRWWRRDKKGKQNRERKEKISDDDREQSRWSWERVSQRMRDGGQLMISKATAIIMQRREKGWGGKMDIQQERHTKCWEKAKQKKKTENNKHISENITCDTAPGSHWWTRTQQDIKVALNV